MGRPRWLDVRVIGGVLLLVASIVIGAKVVGASARTSPVWVAAHDLAAGTVLTAGDLAQADVNLGDRGDLYLDASSSLAGRLLGRALRAGELVPVSAVGPVGDARIVSVSVQPARMPPGVQHGSVIDLYLTAGSTSLGGADVSTRLLQSGITVQSVVAPASGGLSGATSSEYQVALLLSPDRADALVRALPTGEPMVVLRSDGSTDAGEVGVTTGGRAAAESTTADTPTSGVPGG
jgi:hypothetical protein